MDERSKRGGLERARRMSAEARSASAGLAAKARWSGGGGAPSAVCSGILPLGGIPCYNLDDGRRVLSQTGVLNAMELRRGGNSRLGGDRLQNFAVGQRMSNYMSPELMEAVTAPIYFRRPPDEGGTFAKGYEATVLVGLCEAVLEARAERKLTAQQERIAVACEKLVKGLARVGIIALVDEATGYQAVRTKNALAEILEAFIAKELKPWVKTFQPEFYKQVYKLKGWSFEPIEGQPSARPRALGHITNNLVYARLAPGVLDELRRVAERDPSGRLKTHHHRRLTEDLGHPKLREHLASITTAMDLSTSWEAFVVYLDKRFPAFNKNYELDLDDPVRPLRAV